VGAAILDTWAALRAGRVAGALQRSVGAACACTPGRQEFTLRSALGEEQRRRLGGVLSSCRRPRHSSGAAPGGAGRGAEWGREWRSRGARN
jgi:hypothetical protein